MGETDMEMRIGALAARAGCQVVTIRYYESYGLMPRPARSQGGYRLYSDEDGERLIFIRHCRDHGIPLEDIKVLLKLRETPDGDCSVVNKLVDGHIQKLEQQLRSLRKLKDRLVGLRKKCAHGGLVSSCEIMKGLSDRAGCGCRSDSQV
jgi:DNA-binding transcriptional MerR regulator